MSMTLTSPAASYADDRYVVISDPRPGTIVELAARKPAGRDVPPRSRPEPVARLGAARPPAGAGRRRPPLPVPGLRLRGRRRAAALRAPPPRAGDLLRGVRGARGPDGRAGQRRPRTNIQVRIATNRMTVTTRFATVRTATSTPWWLLPAACSPERAAGDRQPDAEDQQPLRLVTHARARRPRTPKVRRRFAAVLPTAVSRSASSVGGPRAGAPAEQQVEQRRRPGSRRSRPARTSPPASRADRSRRRPTRGPAARRPRPAGNRPVSRLRPSRTIPRTSSYAVRTRSTRLSGSSTQSTGTSWMRSPARSARTSSSVSKNHASSSTSGSTSRATSRRIALKPHWASEKRVRSAPAPAGCSRARSARASARARLGSRAAAGCRWPGRSGR